MLGRETEWRQGSLLSEDQALKLGLCSSDCSDVRILIATHDCDLASDKEEEIEVLVGTLVHKADSMLENARNPRRLHISFQKASSREYIEVAHSSRIKIKKSDFAKKCISAQDAFPLDPDQKRSLKQWLAARYGRPAFPNAFETRLRKKAGKHTVEQHIGTIVKPCSEHLIGLFFDLGEERSLELDSRATYYLSISIVYDAIEGGPIAREAAENVASKLNELFEGTYGTPETAHEIALEKCLAVADTKITLADLRRVDQWRLEYVSLAEDPPGAFLPQGAQPL